LLQSTRPLLQKEVKGALKIGNEIVSVLNTDGSADHVVSDACMLLLFRSHIRMRHGRRMLDEGLDTTKRNGELEVMEVVQDSERLLLATLHQESDVSTRARVLFLEDTDLLLAHGLAARVEHGLDCGVLKEEIDDLLGVLGLGAHTQLEGGERTSEKPGGIGVSDGTKNGTHHSDLGDELFAAGSNTSDDIRMAVDELGGRVNDDICAPFVWLAEDRATEGVIHDEEAVVLLGDARSSLQVSDRDGGVGRSLDIDDLALATSGGDSCLDLSLAAASVEGMRLDLEGRKDGTHEHLGATVNGVRECDVVTRTKKREASGGNGTHTTAHQASSLGLLIPNSDLALENLRVGVCNTTVNQSRNFAFLGFSQSISNLESSFSLFCILKNEGGGAEHGRDNSTF